MSDVRTVQLLRAALPQRPELEETIEMQIALIEARANAAPPSPEPWLPAEAEECLGRGEPLLRHRSFEPDWEALARSLIQVCDVAAGHNVASGEACREVAGIASDRAHLSQITSEHLARTAHPTRRSPDSTPSETALVDFVLNHALHPYLSAYAQAWSPLAAGETWRQGACPICGGAPDFSALMPEGGARRLLCARCDAEWSAARGACPFCGEIAAGQWHYYAGEDGVYRLYTCDTCRRYLKTIDRRELARPVHLPAERILSIAMDLAATNAGYFFY